MVLTILDALGSEDVVQLMAAGVLVSPLAYGLEHLTMDFRTFVTERRVVESPGHIVDDLVDRNAGVLPRIQDTPIRPISVNDLSMDTMGTYGTAYCRTVAATLPAQGLRTLVK